MKKEWILNIVIGLSSGFISGFFGAGGGLLIVPFLSFFEKKDEVESRATTIFCIFFMVLVSSFLYFKQDLVPWNVSMKCAIGGIIGGYLGSKLLIKINKNILNILYVFFLFFVGIRFLLVSHI